MIITHPRIYFRLIRLENKFNLAEFDVFFVIDVKSEWILSLLIIIQKDTMYRKECKRLSSPRVS